MSSQAFKHAGDNTQQQQQQQVFNPFKRDAVARANTSTSTAAITPNSEDQDQDHDHDHIDGNDRDGGGDYMSAPSLSPNDNALGDARPAGDGAVVGHHAMINHALPLSLSLSLSPRVNGSISSAPHTYSKSPSLAASASSSSSSSSFVDLTGPDQHPAPAPRMGKSAVGGGHAGRSGTSATTSSVTGSFFATDKENLKGNALPVPVPVPAPVHVQRGVKRLAEVVQVAVKVPKSAAGNSHSGSLASKGAARSGGGSGGSGGGASAAKNHSMLSITSFFSSTTVRRDGK
jgi:hypothetical protein